MKVPKKKRREDPFFQWQPFHDIIVYIFLIFIFLARDIGKTTHCH